MSRIFLSYAHEDTVVMRRIFDWLVRNGWRDEVFFDDSQRTGIVGGEAWRDALRAAAGRCEAVIMLISHNWLASPICRSEFEMGEKFRKAIIPVVLEGELAYDKIPRPVTGWYQLIDRAKSPDDEFYLRLQDALTRAGAGPESFPIPENAHPYPGLSALGRHDAALFFGRDVEVLQTTEIIRDIRMTGRQRMLVILGNSGSGKSSLLRAGLWPRLYRDDRNFIALPVIRPGNAILSGESGLWRSLASALTDSRWVKHLPDNSPRTPMAIAQMIESIENVGNNAERLPAVLDTLRTASARALLDPKKAPSDVIFAVDQAEELFNAEGREEADRFLKLMQPLLAPEGRVIIVLTIRSDTITRLQTDSRFTQSSMRLFNLPPMPMTSLPYVIDGPAKRLGLKVNPLLTEALLTDSRGADALPLLAFTLRAIYNGRLDPEILALDDYERLGGVRMMIQEAAKKARSATLATGVSPEEYDLILQRSFIHHLVRINETGDPARRIVRRNEFASDCIVAIGHLVEQRLLIQGAEGDESTVEIAHEAVLREWSEVTALIAQHRDFLAWREQVSRQYAEYKAKRGDFLTGRSLAIALGFLEEFGQVIAPEVENFIAESQVAANRDQQARERERERARQSELQVARERAQAARRDAWRIGIFAVIVSLFAIGLGVAMWRVSKASATAEREAQITESLRLAGAAEDQIQRVSWPAGRAIAWLALPHDIAMKERPITDEAAGAVYRSPIVQFLDRDGAIQVTYSPNGPYLLFFSTEDGQAELYNTLTGKLILDLSLRGWRQIKYDPMKPYEATPARGYVPEPQFTSDGEFLVVVHGDGTAEAWRTSDGIRAAVNYYDRTDSSLLISREGRFLLRITSDDKLAVVDIFSQKPPLFLNQIANEQLVDEYDSATYLGLIEDPSRNYLWLVEVYGRSAPIYTLFDRMTGMEVMSVGNMGNVDIFAFGPEASGRVLVCGLNNYVQILDFSKAVGEKKVVDINLAPPSLSAFLADESEVRLDAEFATKSDGNGADCAISGDGRLALVNFGERIALYDMASGKLEDATGRYPSLLTSTYVGSSDFVQRFSGRQYGAVGLNYDGSVIYGITGSKGSTGNRALVFHNVQTGELLSRIETSARIRDYVVDNEARTALIRASDGSISVWDVMSGILLTNILDPKPENSDSSDYGNADILLDPSGYSVASVTRSYDPPRDWPFGHIAAYRLRPDAAVLIRSDESYRTGYLPPDAAGITLGTENGIVERRGLDGQSIATAKIHEGAVVDIVPGADETLITAGWDGRLALLDANSLSMIAGAEAHETGVSALAVSADGSRIASGGQDGTIAIWSDGLDEPPLRFSVHDTAISKLLFTAEGSHLFSAGFDGRITLRRATSGEDSSEILEAGRPVWDLAEVPSTGIVAAASGSGTITIWDPPRDDKMVKRWTQKLDSRIQVLAVHPAGRYLAAGLEDGRIVLMNPSAERAPSITQMRTLAGHRAGVIAIEFLGAGKLLAAASRDRTLRIWDLETGRQVATYEGSGNIPLDMVVSKDGQQIATVFADNLVELRRLSGKTLRDAITEIGALVAIAPPVSHALCAQLRVTGMSGADEVCAAPD